MTFLDAREATVTIEVKEGVIFRTDLAGLYFIIKYGQMDEWFRAIIPAHTYYEGSYSPEIKYRILMEKIN